MIGKGKFTIGMVVEIPATFRDSNQQPVEVNDVVVDIQHFDKNHRQIIHILPEAKMNLVAKGMYLYRFKVPPNAEPGNYVVNVKAKHGGSISKIIETSDTFEVVESYAEAKPQDEPPVMVDVSASMEQEKSKQEYVDPAKDFDFKTFKIDQINKQVRSNKVDIEDLVVDVYNLPVKGVHVNVYEKAGFMPKSPNNVKVGSTITDDNGVWKMQLAPGDYVFTYKGINKKENREFRKV